MKKNYSHVLLILIYATLQARGDTPSPLKQAAYEQQKSISELVAALKEVKKAIKPPGQSPDSSKEKKNNPFKNKQEYKNVPPENKLQQLEKQQKEILNKLAEQAKEQQLSKDEFSVKQQQITDDLKKMEANPDLDEAVREALKDAAEASAQAADAIKEDAGTEARISAQKALAKIKQAQQEINKSAQEIAEKALDQAGIALAKAEQERKNRNGEKAGSEAAKAQEILARAAEEQLRKGNQSRKKELDDLARKISENDLVQSLKNQPMNGETATKLAEIREAVAAARQGKKTNQEEMETALRELQELKKEMQYLAKKPKQNSQPRMSEILSQSISQCNRIGRMAKKTGDSASHKPGQDGSNDGRNESSLEQDIQFVKQLVVNWEKQKKNERNIDQTLPLLIVLTDRIIVKAQQTLDPQEQATIVRNPAGDEVPEKYQDDVAAYFEQLSESGTDQP